MLCMYLLFVVLAMSKLCCSSWYQQCLPTLERSFSPPMVLRMLRGFVAWFRYQNKWIRTKALEVEQERGFSFSIMGEAMHLANTGNTAWMVCAMLYLLEITAGDISEFIIRARTSFCALSGFDVEFQAYTKDSIGRANTALVHHNNKLLALFEQDRP